MNKTDVLLGLQWGDEGKGKLVDVLAPKYDVIARFQGGANAGHTLEFEGRRHVLHQIPSGIFRPHSKNVIGNGVVLDPITFKQEIEALDKVGIDGRKNLYISKKATLIIPTHCLLDQASEQKKGEARIGSTLKGIGPAYRDKVGRRGLRVGDILSSTFHASLEQLAEDHLEELKHYDMCCDWEGMKQSFLQAIDFIKQFNLVDSEYIFYNEMKNGSTILAEGAQGTLLDIDFGSYPFVTSSNTVASGACTGLGIPPSRIGEVFGVFKAYGTRVGTGPFPTEIIDAVGDKMRRAGNEFGATTGRPRRCGWLDLPALKYAIMINGVSQLFMMKADVLDSFPLIKVCMKYKLDNQQEVDRVSHECMNRKITPVYKEMKGWNCSLKEVTTPEQMPLALSAYIAFLQKELAVPISLVSIGPDRQQTIFLSSALQKGIARL